MGRTGLKAGSPRGPHGPDPPHLVPLRRIVRSTVSSWPTFSFMTIYEGSRPIASQRRTCTRTKAVSVTNTTDLLVSIHEKVSDLRQPTNTVWHIQSQLVLLPSSKRVGTFLPIRRIYPEARQYRTHYGCRKPFEPRRHHIWRKLKNVAALGFRRYSCARLRGGIDSELAMQLTRAEE